MDSPNWMKIKDCFGASPPLPAYEDFLKKESIRYIPLTGVYVPFKLDNLTIFVGRLGFWYFVSYHGRRIGPVFEDVFTRSCCEYGLYAINAGKGVYIFRGKRDGKYILVMIRVDGK
jgi:hypothetical protein